MEPIVEQQIVYCKSCKQRMFPAYGDKRSIGGRIYVRLEYQCEDPKCDAVQELQHRSSPILLPKGAM